MDSFVFDATEIDTNDELLPVGTYDFLVLECELKHTKNGNGQYVSLKLQVIGGEHDGRLLFKNMNIMNANAQAEEIGKKEFARFVEGVYGEKRRITDLQDFVNRQVNAKVKHTTGKDGEKRADLTAYKSSNNGNSEVKEDNLPF
jgi:hypothetical protein